MYLINGNEYKYGNIFDSIAQYKDIKAVISLDIGDIRSSISYATAAGVWIPRPLYLCNNNITIPTRLSKSGDNYIIWSALDQNSIPDDLTTCFKIQPSLWPAETSVENSVSEYVFFKAYIELLWNKHKDILFRRMFAEARQKLSFNDILLVVGCPASKDWLCSDNQYKYKALLNSITGFDEKNISIVPESLSILPEYLRSKAAVPDICTVIYDFGEYETDFTLMYLGKKIKSKTIMIGGYDIDEAMYGKLIDEKELEIPVNQSGAVMLQLRQIRENWYDGDKSEKRYISYIKDGKPFIFDFEISEKWMEEAFEKAIKKPNLSDSGIDERSWIDTLSSFIGVTKNAVSNALPINAVKPEIIVTGDSCKVDKVKNIIEKYYVGNENTDSILSVSSIVFMTSPSDSAANGLIRYQTGLIAAADNVDEKIKLIKTEKNKTSESMGWIFDQKTITVGDEYKKLCEFIPYALFDICWELIKKAVDQTIEKKSNGNNITLKDEFNAIVDQTDITSELSKEILKADRGYAKIIMNNINKISSEKLYNTAFSDIDKFIEFRINDTVKNEIGDVLKKSVEENTFINNYKNNLIDLQGKLVDARDDERNNEKIIINNLRYSIKIKTNSESFRSVYNEMLDKLYEIALGKSLFMLFDEKPEIGE